VPYGGHVQKRLSLWKEIQLVQNPLPSTRAAATGGTASQWRFTHGTRADGGSSQKPPNASRQVSSTLFSYLYEGKRLLLVRFLGKRKTSSRSLGTRSFYFKRSTVTTYRLNPLRYGIFHREGIVNFNRNCTSALFIFFKR